MDPSLVIAFVGATLGPLGGVITGVLLNKRTQRAHQETTKVAAKEAATHEFEAITAGYTEYTRLLEARAAKTTALEERITGLEDTLVAVLAYVEALELRIPEAERPPRPDLNFRR